MRTKKEFLKLNSSLSYVALPCFLYAIAAFGQTPAVPVSEPRPIPQAEESQLRTYKPMYFLTGKPDTKLQLSFDLRVLRKVELHFGYTQLMMWDLSRKSAPFRDVNYNPELFYRLKIDSAVEDQVLDFGIFEHESNGRDGSASRTWNRVYLRYTSAELHWSVKAWVPFSYKRENKDLLEYRGLYELIFSLAHIGGGWARNNDLILRIFPGGKSYVHPFLGGQELTFRLKNLNWSFFSLLVLQAFHGYGENLLEYNQERWGIRAGFGF